MLEAKIEWFDMDHTLIHNDCDVSWKEFLIQEGLAEPEETARLNEAFYQDYLRGTLDNDAFLKFQLREFKMHTEEEMRVLAQKHFEIMVKPRIYPEALALVRSRLARQIPCCIITSTNRVIAQPVAEFFGITELIAAEVEMADGRYTGNSIGVYPVGPGKVTYLEEYCRKHGCVPADFAYYGDSINDTFLLEKVGHPYAVNPGNELRKLAEEKHWNVLHFSSEGLGA